MESGRKRKRPIEEGEESNLWEMTLKRVPTKELRRRRGGGGCRTKRKGAGFGRLFGGA